MKRSESTRRGALPCDFDGRALCRMEETELLLRAARLILHGGEHEEIVREIVRLAMEATGAEEGCLALFAEPWKKLASFSVTLCEEEICDVAFDKLYGSREEMDRLFASKGGVFCNQADQEYTPSDCGGVRSQVRNYLHAPLIAEETRIGVLSLVNSADGFSERDVHLVSALGELAAVSVKNNRDRKERERSEVRYRSLYNSMEEAVALHEIVHTESGEAVDYRILDVNPAFERTIGFDASEAVGALASKLYGVGEPPFLDRYIRVAEGGDPIRFEVDWARANKVFSVVAFSPQPGQFATVTSDITESRRLARQLRHAEKMQAIGHLAGGIAHDFNNVLGGIMGYADLAMMDAQEGGELERHLSQIVRAAQRAQRLVHQILLFSRRSEESSSAVCLQPIVKEVGTMLRSAVPASVKIETKLQKDVTVLAQATKIHEVLMNLATNSIQAMGGRGELKLSLRREEVVGELSGRLGPIAPGWYGVIGISDTGPGMSEEIIDRMFEPFFTTKKVGEGTGMGLAVVFGIVEAHGGNILVRSQVGGGTEIQVYLKECPECEEGDGILAARIMPRGRERVLFVDDEEVIASMAMELFRGLGYKVTTTTNPKRALDMVLDNPQGYDVVITDQTMPDMTGVELAKAILKKRPEIPIILCTGYSEGISYERARSLGLTGFCSKPIRNAELASLVRQVLDENGVKDG